MNYSQSWGPSGRQADKPEALFNISGRPRAQAPSRTPRPGPQRSMKINKQNQLLILDHAVEVAHHLIEY